MRRIFVVGLILLGCGGGAAAPRSSEPLMSRTFAGQNRCNAKTHERPFVIEWDATDMSSFEARATNDIIFVRYEGCDLQVLDGCVDDSVRGSLGSYKNVEWTSGSLESMDIADEDDLFAKLPLGAADLGGRVHSGEKLHMEYFVAGTRAATRSAVYRDSLKRIAGCEGATHFVYAFNVGAFALGSTSQLTANASGSYFGFGAGAAKSSESSALKRGGNLVACHADSASGVEGCKVPIRLTLREISPGADPDAKAAAAPETSDAASLAGRMKADSDRQHEAEEHVQAARRKLGAHDGKGCLAELDQHDALDSRPESLSTNTSAYVLSELRSECLMAAGQCDAGKKMFRISYGNMYPNVAPSMVDTITSGYAGQYGCK